MKDMLSYMGQYSCRVYYEDVDVGGICYHSKYLNFCERARSEVFFSQNSSPIQGEHHFVIKNINANFYAPSTFGDKLVIDTYTKEYKNTSVILYQEVKNENDKVIFEMDVVLVCLKKDKVSRIPDTFKNMFLTQKQV